MTQQPLFRRTISRRSMAQGVAGAFGAAMIATPRFTLARQASPATPASTPATNGYYPSNSDAVPDAYTQAPAPFTSFDGVPGTGRTVSSFAIAYNPPPPARDQNQFWQELERRLGVTWDVQMTPQADYGTKSAALLAGGDLPDLFYLNPQQGAPQQYQALAQGAFLDLTDRVTGDTLAAFPNLAKFPQSAWDNVRFDGKIYGVPKATQSRFSSLPFYRADWVEKLGIAPPTTPDTVHDMLVAFGKNDPDGNGRPDTFGMGRHWFGWHAMDNKLSAYMFRAPHEWTVNADGSMSFVCETDEFRQELEWQAKLWSDGGFHPDAPAMTYAQAAAAFIAGQTGLHLDALTTNIAPNGNLDKLQANVPDARLAPYLPVGVDGAPGATWNDPGFFGFTAIPASVNDDDRVSELLRILDYLAAPFGSEEWNFFNYGIDGVHNTVNENGVRIINDRGRNERSDLLAPMAGLTVFYYPEQPDLGPQIQQIALSSFALGRDNPNLTLYSPANVEHGAELDQFGVDRVTALVTGREPLSNLDAAIADWKSRGGDQIRGELEEALQKQQGG